jgi:hypothetical protein
LVGSLTIHPSFVYEFKMPYAVTQFPTPVFNTPHIASCFGGNDGNTLSLDHQGRMMSVETVLFPQSKIELLERVEESPIWRIRTSEYSYKGSYYIDERFVQFVPVMPASRPISVPSAATIIARLNALVGTRYIWGGTWPEGIDLVPQLYPSRAPLHQLPSLVQDTWTFKGLDCTGLLHYATNGFTERNSSRLLHFGKPVSIEGLSLSEIISKVKSLDLIVWNGHVVCILDQHTTIESKLSDGGVVKCDLSNRISHIMQELRPVDDWRTTDGPRFVIRRWS